MNSCERLLAVLNGQPVDRLPVQPIFMRYIARTIGVDYSDFCMNPEVKVKGNFLLAEKFGIDAVTVMSDPYAEAFDHGAELEWYADRSPGVKHHVLQSPDDLKELEMLSPEYGLRMSNRLEEIWLFRQGVKGQIPIVGWVEGPLAQACIFRDITSFLTEIYTESAFAADLLDFVTSLEIDFLRLQVDAGADVIGVGDAAASLVSPAYFELELAPRHKSIVQAIHSAGAVARLHICGNIDGKAEAISTLGYDIVDVDHLTDLTRFRAEIGKNTVLLGNVDPVRVLEQSTPGQVREEFLKAREISGDRCVIGAGCEVTPDTPEENILAMLEAATL